MGTSHKPSLSVKFVGMVRQNILLYEVNLIKEVRYQELYIKKNDYSFPVSQGKYDTYLTSEGGVRIEILTLHLRGSISILTPKALA